MNRTTDEERAVARRRLIQNLRAQNLPDKAAAVEKAENQDQLEAVLAGMSL